MLPTFSSLKRAGWVSFYVYRFYISRNQREVMGVGQAVWENREPIPGELFRENTGPLRATECATRQSPASVPKRSPIRVLISCPWNVLVHSPYWHRRHINPRSSSVVLWNMKPIYTQRHAHSAYFYLELRCNHYTADLILTANNSDSMYKL
jgi:hypothetical protein